MENSWVKKLVSAAFWRHKRIVIKPCPIRAILFLWILPALRILIKWVRYDRYVFVLEVGNSERDNQHAVVLWHFRQSACVMSGIESWYSIYQSKTQYKLFMASHYNFTIKYILRIVYENYKPIAIKRKIHRGERIEI